MPAMAMKHDKDPSQVLLDKVGSLKGVEIPGNQVLLAIYERPQVTAGGIRLPDKYRDEERYQGKAAVVVAKGQRAFDEGYRKNFGDMTAEIGDWIVIRPSDGWPVTVNGVLCRMITDEAIKMKVDSPDRVW